MKKRVETANELSRFLTLQRKLVENRLYLEAELRELPAQMEHQKKLIEKANIDKEFYTELMGALPVPTTTAEKKANAEERKKLREMIFGAIKNNELKTSESILTEYCGFKIVLPANMKKENPFVWLQRTGRYYAELGDTELGILTRIDNFLNGLDDHIEKLNNVLANMSEKEKKNIRAELSSRESYTDKIDELKEQIEAMDKKLGVDKK